MPAFSYHLRREGIEFGGRFGRQSITVHLALIVIFGILLPWWKGIDFFDPVILSAYGSLGILFAAPAAVQAFGESRPQSMAQATARIAIAVMYAQAMALAMAASGVITVYAAAHPPFPPDFKALALALGFGTAASIALAAIAGWVTLESSAAAAKLTVRIVFLVLLGLFFFRSRWLPDVTGEGAWIALAAAALALALMRRRIVN